MTIIMKNIFFLAVLLTFSVAERVSAQFEGRRFISGTAQINFNNVNPEYGNEQHAYGYSFDVSLGKFKTNTRASGWNLSTSLTGQKQTYFVSANNNFYTYDKSGITSVGGAVGRFWHFYKHFNDKVGIFGGPNVNLSYTKGTLYAQGTNYQSLTRTATNEVAVALGLSAGLYYNLSEKWWITASLALSNPVSVDYTIAKTTVENEKGFDKAKTFNYSLQPAFTFPSVGLGVRYFCGR